MATYTTYLNLEKPATSENFDLLKINANWDKVDAGYGQIANPQYYDITAGNNVTIYRQKAYKIGKLVFISAYAKITASIAANERLFTIPWAPASAMDIPILYVNSNKVGGLFCSGGAYQVVKNVGELANGDEIMFNCWYVTT